MAIRKLGFLASHNGSNVRAVLEAVAAHRLNADPVIVITNNSKAGVVAVAKQFDVPVARMTSLDFTPLENALAQLEEGLREAGRQPNSEVVRDGVIQRFEYSHELALKFIRRSLESVFGDAVDQMAYNDVLRTAAERGLISDVKAWFAYRTARNNTSHTYDAAIAADVFRSAGPFLIHAR